ncbi:MAG: pirin family protein [Nitrospira sp.]|nr:pirin family protein [Nitrospira sp.]MDH4245869.1 pirin family protein [Nitrospira sp.]MDH4356874.1 pirin family protein [Nitrospira sp.]MDH5320071.1 pirin family protein [Nitrospira sp.]
MSNAVMSDKKVVQIHRYGSRHWVGDGFPVRNLIPGNSVGETLSPFLLLDYAGPENFSPTDQPRGVGEHPHRGFETVTIVYDGVVAHRDSTGSGGVIGPGDVQWMTAASGVVHEEMHEKEWASKGGVFHAIQLWVNLPRAHKMSSPGYQTLLKRDIPVVELAGGAGQLRVIAGEFRGISETMPRGIKGPAKTFTPVHLYDVRLKAGHATEIAVPTVFNTAVFVLQGGVSVNGSGRVGEAELVQLDNSGERMTLKATDDTVLLVLSGEPIDEPVARYGPFVMNTKTELVQAVNDYQAGKMGHLS